MTEQTGEQPQGHPAWQELLSEVPEDLHPILKPKLEEWERNYSQKLQGTVEQYKPYEVYQPLIENDVPIEVIQKSLWLAQQLEENPKAIVEQAINSFGLDYVPKDSIQQPSRNDDDYDDDDDNYGEPRRKQPEFKIEDHPAFKQMQEKAQQLEQYLESQRQTEEEQQAMSALEEELRELHEKHDIKNSDGSVTPGFDDLFVTALTAQGVEPEQAISLYNDTINSRAQLLAGLAQHNEPNPPVIMGGDGNTGSGVPRENVRMGDLSKNDLNDLVFQLINSDKQG